jgi:Tol biopolymer transport system component/DNA-binding winged helix-turn-helix (wHTH) protein
MEKPSPSDLFCFGVFEVDLRVGELRKQGVKVKLQEQPLQILTLLLKRQGQLITREELRQTLWSDDTFVDFDHSLSTAIGKIREAIGDSAESPRFIETVARRGYRFIAPVQKLEPKPRTDSNLSISAESSATDAGIDGKGQIGVQSGLPPISGEIPSDCVIVPGRSATETVHGSSSWSGGTLRSRNGLLWSLAFVLVLAALVLAGGVFFRREPKSADAIRLSLLLPEGVTFSDTEAPVVSPDGRLLAFVATNSSGESWLWVRHLGSMDAQRLPDTEEASQPFWSPDSRWIGYFAKHKLKKIEVSGRTSQTVCDCAQAGGGTWNRDGLIIFSPDLELYQVSAAGGKPTRLTTLDNSRRELLHWWPHFLPDGRHFLYLVYSVLQQTRGIYLGSLDSLATHRLLPADSSAAYAAPGCLFFIRDRTLMAQWFDPKLLQLKGEAFAITRPVAYSLHTVRGAFSVSETGVLAYWSAGESQLVWIDRTGKRLGPLGALRGYDCPSFSPDERTVAVGASDPETGNEDLWLVDLSRGVPTRLTFDPSPDGSPVWSPNGSRIAFSSLRDGTWDLYQKASNGTGKDEVLLKGSENEYVEDWSRDGRFITYVSLNAKGDWDLWVLPMFGDRKPIPYLQTGFNELYSQFSPDGRWISYFSDESGKFEVYVRSFPVPDRKWTVSTGGGSQPKWRRDGKELFYLAPDGKLMAVDVQTGADFRVGIPKVLFDTHKVSICDDQYAVTNDGQRFLVSVRENTSAPFIVVINWTAELKR